VKNDRHTADPVQNALDAPQLALHDLDLGLERGKIAAIAGGEVVEHTHVVATLDQRPREARTNAAGTTSDENLHARDSQSGELDPEIDSYRCGE
jgi:hypothetical protein